MEGVTPQQVEGGIASGPRSAVSEECRLSIPVRRAQLGCGDQCALSVVLTSVTCCSFRRRRQDADGHASAASPVCRRGHAHDAAPPAPPHDDAAGAAAAASAATSAHAPTVIPYVRRTAHD